MAHWHLANSQVFALMHAAKQTGMLVVCKMRRQKHAKQLPRPVHTQVATELKKSRPCTHHKCCCASLGITVLVHGIHALFAKRWLLARDTQLAARRLVDPLTRA